MNNIDRHLQFTQSISLTTSTESQAPTHLVPGDHVQYVGRKITLNEGSPTETKVKESVSNSNFGSDPIASTGRARQVAAIIIGASATFVGKLASKVAEVGKKIFDQAQKLRTAEGRSELKEGIKGMPQQIKSKMASLRETASSELKKAKKELPGRIKQFKEDFPADVRASANKLKRSAIKFFQQLKSPEGRKELKEDMKEGMAQLGKGAVDLKKRVSKGISQMGQRLQPKLDAYEAKGEKIIADASEIVDAAKTAVREKWKSLTSSKEKTETIATSNLAPLSETQGPPVRELLGELLKEARSLRKEVDPSVYKLRVDKEGHFKLKKREAGLEVRKGSSDNARRTVETVIKVLKDSIQEGILTPGDSTDIANMRNHLTTQMEATFRHNPELLSAFNRAFDDVEAHMVYLPLAEGTRTMLEHFDKNKAVLFKVFEFVGAKDNKILVDSEVYTPTTISNAAEKLYKPVEAFERYRQDGDLEALKNGQTDAKFARVLKTGMVELLKAGMKKMEPNYKTSESQFAKEYREIDAMFTENASAKGVPMDWDKLSRFIEQFGKKMEGFSEPESFPL